MASFSFQVLSGQLLIGLVNGAFYAILSIGLALIFGMLNIVNFAHGAFYMLGAFCAWLLMDRMGIGYGWSLLLAPLIVGALGVLIERLALRRIAALDHLYGLLLTFGIAAVLQGALTLRFDSISRPYAVPDSLAGVFDIGFMVVPKYRIWVVVCSLAVCLVTWWLVERTRLGSYLRAATENPSLVRAFGVRVPLLITLTYGAGAALAAFSGVLAAPILQVSPGMGGDLLIFVFAVVVIGGMGSIGGAIISGFGVGLIEGIAKYLWPSGSNTVVFILMTLILLVRPGGLFGRALTQQDVSHADRAPSGLDEKPYRYALIGAIALVLSIAPLFIFPETMMTVMVIAIFALAFNFLVGFGGLVSFGHAMFFGTGAYLYAYVAKAWGWPLEAALVAGIAGSAALAFVVGLLSIRRHGVYFAMVTLAFSQMVYFLYLRAPFTRGEDGIQGVPRFSLFTMAEIQGVTLYVYILIAFMLCLLFVYRLIHSPFGQILTAIRDNPARATSLGYDVNRYKLAAFVFSGALAGLAGGLKVVVQQMATLADAHASLSGDVILMSLLGGLGTVTGPVAGSAILVGLQNGLATMGPWVMVIQGAILTLCVLAARRGIVGSIAFLSRKPL